MDARPSTFLLLGPIALGAGRAEASPRAAPLRSQRAELARFRAVGAANTDLERTLFFPALHTNLELFHRWGLPTEPLVLIEREGKKLSLSTSGTRFITHDTDRSATTEDAARLGVTSTAELNRLLERSVSEHHPGLLPEDLPIDEVTR